jgi:hypothetical protein
MGHGTVFWHDLKYGMAQNILGYADITQTRESCRTQDLGTAGYMIRPTFWAVLGPAWHEDGT